MKFSNCCAGCGCWLDDQDNDKQLCYRCFQLKHYNKLIADQSLIDNQKTYLDDLDDRYTNVYLVTDLFSLNHDIQYFANHPIHQLNVIVNKMDLLPQTFNFNLTDELIKKTFLKHNLKVNKVLYTSIYNKHNMEALNDFMVHHHKLPNVLLGYSDVGKSSLINALLNLNHIQDQMCLTSCYINTTNTIKVFDLAQYQLVDYPGIYDHGNILNYLAPSDIKKVIDYKFAHPYQLQMYQSQRIYIDGLATIDILLNEHQKSSISLYVSPMLKIKRKNISDHISRDNDQAQIHYLDPDTKYHTYSFDINPQNYKTDFLIYGLGLAVIHKGTGKIIIRVHDQVCVQELPYALI